MRRVALLSDIHGNSVALNSVLESIDSSEVAERYCLGDLIGYGPDPVGVINVLRDRHIPTILGNYDEGVASRRGDCGCYYATDADRALGDRSYAFTDSLITDSDAEWLLALPRQIELAEEGAAVLLTHASPRKINEYLLPDREEGQLARLALGAGADAVCHGHVHIPFHRSFSAALADGVGHSANRQDAPERFSNATIHYVSCGSVGKPKDGDPRAGWVELVMGSAEEVASAVPDDAAVGPVGSGQVWLGVAVHRVDYDIEAVASAMRDRGLPEGLIEALRKA